MDNVIKMQTEFTEEMLFEYCMVSSLRENEVFSKYPSYIEKKELEELRESALTIDGIIKHIMENQLKQPDMELFHLPEFPMKKEILKLIRPLDSYLWTRYDGFCREGGGVFFSEFNYDKPCAQREILYNQKENRKRNAEESDCSDLEEDFRSFVEKQLEPIKKLGLGEASPCIAVLVDPGHLEEAHLAMLYKKMLTDILVDVVIISPKNIVINGEYVYAFNRKIDFILRQFPTEHLYECPEIEQLLELHDRGNVTLLNDPRWILGQAKSLFIYLWELAEDPKSFLSENERRTIFQTIPKTRLFRNEMKEALLCVKNTTVIKPIYGRYSLDVFIGAMMTQEEWTETLEYVISDKKEYIVQEFCPIRKDVSMKFNRFGYEEMTSFGNIGIYLTNGKYSGACVRWSSDYLSADEIVWTTPLLQKQAYGLYVSKFKDNRGTANSPDYISAWSEVNEEAAFKIGYTGGYTGNQHSFSIESAIITEALESRLKTVTNKMADIIRKTTDFIIENSDLLCPVLDIPKELESLVCTKRTNALSFFGRMDWILSTEGKLKFLEFNSETPAGLIETLGVTPIIKERYHKRFKNPNTDMAEAIRRSFSRIIEDFSKEKTIKTVGLTATCYYEDWYNLIYLSEILKTLPYEFVIGEFTALQGDSSGLSLNGRPIDAVYRFYPLDWFTENEKLINISEGLLNNCYSVNPPSTLINQSKAFLGVVWQLMQTDFYSMSEKAFIEEHVPFTSLKKDLMLLDDYVVKDIYGREGHNIKLSISGIPSIDENSFARKVYQCREDINPYRIRWANTLKVEEIPAYPVIGTYVADDRYCGVFLRFGKRVTDNWAIFMPVYIENELGEEIE